MLEFQDQIWEMRILETGCNIRKTPINEDFTTFRLFTICHTSVCSDILDNRNVIINVTYNSIQLISGIFAPTIEHVAYRIFTTFFTNV